ncbi:MAG TPA: response regulator [Cyclobacteriaceae bacterium]
MINVLLVDDHQIVLDGLSLLLKAEKDIHKVDEVQSGKLALKALEVYPVDVAVVDIDMPDMDGIKTTKLIKKKYPAVKVLILTMHNHEPYIKALIEAGSSGYILKNRGKEELVSAIRKVAAGSNYFSDAVTNTLVKSMRKQSKTLNPENIILTDREIEVLKLIAQGYTNPQISETLHISLNTVGTHRRHLIHKTGAKNARGLSMYAYEHGILEEEEEDDDE